MTIKRFTARRAADAIGLLQGETDPANLVRYCGYSQPQVDACVWAIEQGITPDSVESLDDLLDKLRQRVAQHAMAKQLRNRARKFGWARQTDVVAGWQMPAVSA